MSCCQPKPNQKPGRRLRLLFVGYGRAGKDEACKFLSSFTTLRNAGTTSKYLAKYVAEGLGISEEEAYARRHESDEMRILWFNKGNEIRNGDPTLLAREALKHGELSGGIRSMEEILGVRDQGLCDLIIWVANNRVPKDPTVEFSEKECDLVIPNHWSLSEYYNRLERLALALDLPRRDLTWMEYRAIRGEFVDTVSNAIEWMTTHIPKKNFDVLERAMAVLEGKNE